MADDPCTDCGDTGVTFQTERRCACQPPLEAESTQQSEVERVARAIATAEVFMPDEAPVIVGMKTIPTWQSRLPHARAALAALRPKVREAEVRAMMEDLRLYLDADDHILEAHAKRILDRLNQADNGARSEWIIHRGGDCPVDLEAQVEIRLMSGEQSKWRAGAVVWNYGATIWETGDPLPRACRVTSYRLNQADSPEGEK